MGKPKTNAGVKAVVAIQLEVEDVFSPNDGLDWYTVGMRLVVPTNSGKEAVLIAPKYREKIWLWADEEVSVRI